jgi:hypothetical protein
MLGTLSLKEFKEFGEFLKSPYFNKNIHVLKLYEYLRKFYPEFKDSKLNKETVFKKLFPGKKYNDGFLRTIIFNLGKQTEDYLAIINLKKDDLNRGIHLLKELNARKIEKVFLKYYKEIDEAVNIISYHDPEYFYKKYELKDQKEIYMDWSKFKNKDYKSFSENIFTLIDYDLTCFYLSKALNHYRFMLDKKLYEPLNYNFEFIEYIIDYLTTTENNYKEVLKIKLHLNEVLLIKYQKYENYLILKDILFNNYNNLSKSDLYSLHNILHSYCIAQYYSTKDEFLNERFELFKFCLEKKLYLASEHIYFDDIMFGNIVNVAISLNEFSWAESFIEQYKNELSPENYEVVINYSYARIYLNKKNFELALSHLNNIKKMKHLQFKTPIKNLLLMVFYELKLYNQAYYQVDAYRHFLKNNKSSYPEERYERISNFLKYYSKLLKYSERNNKENLNDFKNEVINTRNILNREWLLEKLNEL